MYNGKKGSICEAENRKSRSIVMRVLTRHRRLSLRTTWTRRDPPSLLLTLFGNTDCDAIRSQTSARPPQTGTEDRIGRGWGEAPKRGVEKQWNSIRVGSRDVRFTENAPRCRKSRDTEGTVWCRNKDVCLFNGPPRRWGG